MTTGSLLILAALLLPWVTLAALPFAGLRTLVLRTLPATPLIALALAAFEPAARLDWDGLLLGSAFALDATNRPFLIATGAAWLAASVVAVPFIRETAKSARFLTCFLLATAGNVAVVLSQDAISFYTAFAVMSLSAYGLVNHDGRRRSIFAGRVYIVLAIAGELLLFAALLSIAGQAGGNGFPLAFDDRPPDWAIACVVLGFGIKAGLVPLHVSLPLAYAAAPHPAGVALAGAMLNAGLLGLLRWLPLGEFELPAWGAALAALGLAGILLGVVFGLLQRDSRALLGYSSISQVGLMMLFLAAGFLAPEHWPVVGPLMLVFVVHHAITKTAAFSLTDGAHPARLPRVLWIAVLALPALSLVGVPLTSGAAAKAGLKDALLMTSGGIAALVPWLTLASVGTALLMTRWVSLVSRTAREKMPPGARGFWLAIALILAGIGQPWLLAAGSVDWDGKALWSATWPALAGLALANALWRMHRPAWLRAVPAGDLAHPVARGIRDAGGNFRQLENALAESWQRRRSGLSQRSQICRDAGARWLSRSGLGAARDPGSAVFLAVLALLAIVLLAG